MKNTYELRGYITNLGKYVEGELVGKWITFPIDEDELEQVFEDIQINDRYEEFFFTDWEQSDNILHLGEYENIEDVNDAVESIQTLDDYDYTKALAIIDANGLIAVTDSIDLDDYIFYQDMSLTDVAYELVEDMGLPEFAERYFDYEAFARDLGFENFSETSYGTLEYM
jgi:antirestriction protein